MSLVKEGCPEPGEKRMEHESEGFTEVKDASVRTCSHEGCSRKLQDRNKSGVCSHHVYDVVKVQRAKKKEREADLAHGIAKNAAITAKPGSIQLLPARVVYMAIPTGMTEAQSAQVVRESESAGIILILVPCLPIWKDPIIIDRPTPLKQEIVHA